MTKNPIDAPLAPDDFVRRLDLPTPNARQSFRALVKRRHGAKFLKDFERSLATPDDDDAIHRRYAMVFQNLETARTFQAAATNPALLKCLEWWEAQEHPDGDILDLGCGAGFATCYFAQRFPDRAVVGVDAEPLAVACAQELAASLGVANVSFIEGDAGSLNLGRTFGTVVSFITLTAVQPLDYGNQETLSFLREIPTVERSSRHPMAAVVASHLDATGIHTAVERASGPLGLAAWAGAFAKEGLYVVPSSVTGVPWTHELHGEETVLAAAFSRSRLSHDVTPLEPAAAVFDNFEAEFRVSRLANLHLVRGAEHVWEAEPEEPTPISHVYDLESDGIRYCYETTSLNYRKLEEQSGSSKDGANPAYDRQMLVYQMSVDIGSCIQQDLGLEDLAQDVMTN